MNTLNLVASSVSNYKVKHEEILPQCFSVVDNQPLEIQIQQKFPQRNLFFMIVKKNVIFFFWKTACVLTDSNLTEIDIQDRLSDVLERLVTPSRCCRRKGTCRIDHYVPVYE